MKSKTLGVAALLVLCPVASALAGSVYVPLATDQTVEGVRYQTQVWVTNTDATLRQYTTYFIPSETDGTDRPENWGTTAAVPAGGTTLLSTVTGSGEIGMLEISGAPDILVAGRMVATQQGVAELATSLPVITSRNQFLAGSVAHLQGWSRSTDLRSDFGMVNLGHGEASCTIDVFRSDGSRVQSRAVVGMPPLGHRQFHDALAILGLQAVSAVRSETSCDQPFFVYLRTYNRSTGELSFIQPGITLGESSLQPPGSTPPPPTCGAGSHCYSYLATPYIPTRQAQNHKFFIDVPPGDYNKIHMTMDVTLGEWQQPTSGLHNIFWLARDRNRNLFGYVNLMGPGRNDIMLRHGIGQSQSQKAKIVRHMQANPGQTYHFDYTYDTAVDRITLVVTSNGQELVRITDRPDVNRISIGNGERFAIALSFEEGLNPNEPPSYGWRYQNLNIQFTP